MTGPNFSRLLINLIPISSLLLSGCSFNIQANPDPKPAPTITLLPASAFSGDSTEIFFWVEVPENTPAGEIVQLVVLDEVTGLTWNQSRYDMQSLDDTHFGLALRVTPGTLIRYRYERVNAGGQIAQEFTTGNTATRYRLFMVDGPGEVNDQVARWADTQLVKGTGRIFGTAVDKDSGAPIPNLMILAGGERVLTNADGSYLIPRLVEGKHQIVAFSLDGRYFPYKQDAVVASQAATPASLSLQAAPPVEVTFEVQVPENTIPTIPVKIAGNYGQLGNTFTDLQGGTSLLPAKMPELEDQGNGLFRLTLNLYAGMHLQYKYSLGDGFWNVEQSGQGEIFIREIRIPRDRQQIKIEDQVETWQTPGYGGVIFDVKVPEYTPQHDQIYIQFLLNEWMAPLPMWQVNTNRWAYQLVSPLNITETLTYRYCRNGVCGDQYSIATESEVRETPLTNAEPMLVSDTVGLWNNLNPRAFPATVLGVEITPRTNFTTGIMLAPEYHPQWDAQALSTILAIKDLNANELILTPTWHATFQNPPHFTTLLGEDQGWSSLVSQIQTASVSELQVAIFPQVTLPVDAQNWWDNTPDSSAWWTVWWEQYSAFVIHHADLAQGYDADTFILGGEWLQPGLPGARSGMPVDIQQRWDQLIQNVRLHYSGELGWYVPYHDNLRLDALAPQFDVIYLHWGVSLATWSGAPSNDIQSRAELLLRDKIAPYQEALGKPVILVASYPSAEGGVTYCLPEGGDGCSIQLNELSPVFPESSGVLLDLQEQVEVYNAILAAINNHPFISGFVSNGYFPPVGLEDKSTSIHGKPAEDALRYWFGEFLNP